jgi:hypothetical protein
MSRHRFPVKTTLALAFALSTTFPAAASAHTDFTPRGSQQVPITPPSVVVQTSNGFDWSDAGIGAAGGLGLSMVALGGGLVLTQRRGRSHRNVARPAI